VSGGLVSAEWAIGSTKDLSESPDSPKKRAPMEVQRGPRWSSRGIPHLLRT